jgi:hypothetical protein
MLLDRPTISLLSNVNIVSAMFTDVQQCSLKINDPEWVLWALGGLNVKTGKEK